ncbi:hypothetical protein QQS21_008452 [Conoideocrella luteorostrata]|uniref:GED domain-containing protein n=1 Tax=Conoideocrella luteorostrata TaxID=1105319 RepID=A0AAJ0CJQ3_9HYPO|nr:hypothetical protein QQS21_008452 [Conoideocrella luteorostrata]
MTSSHVLEMSDEDISRLAGETQAASTERTRLEAKRGILEAGLQRLKSLHRRRNVDPLKQNQVVVEKLEQISAMTPKRSEKASTDTNCVRSASQASIPDQTPHSLKSVEMPSPVDEWLARR